MNTKYIVNFSGGACSFWAAWRTIERHGRENVILLFADTLYEHPDLYDFNRKAEDVLGVKIERICEGLSPWELFEKKGLIGNDRYPICSTELKREPCNAWMESVCEMDSRQANWCKPQGVVVFGFDWTELHRVEAFQAQHPNWTVSAPMTEAPLWDKCRMLAECEKLGFQTPTLYRLGFPHNNCGGFCVKAGISHYVHLYNVLPERFGEVEEAEMKCRLVMKERGIENCDFTVLKDRRGGRPKPLTLRDLRLRIEAGEKFPATEWGGCGCGGETGGQAND